VQQRDCGAKPVALAEGDLLDVAFFEEDVDQAVARREAHSELLRERLRGYAVLEADKVQHREDPPGSVEL
jgi:hypothetical protein